MPVYLDVQPKLSQSALSATAREIRTVFDALGRDVSGGLGRHLSDAFKGFDTSAARREVLALQNEYRRLQDAQLEAARVATRSAAEVEVANRRMAEQIAKYGDASSQAARAQMLHADAQARATRDMRVNADAVAASEAAHRKLGDAATDSAAAATAASRIFNGVGIASVGAFGAVMVETTKKAGDFQQQMQKLHAAASVPADQLKTISDGVLRMAGQVGYSTTELNNAMFTIMKTGVNAADGLKVLQAAAQGANAEQADLGEVVNALTTSMHDFHVPIEDVNRLMSQMVTAVGESKGSLQDFAGALHTIEPMAGQLGLKLEDVWGVLAQMSQSGTSFDQAADNMVNAMRSLSGAQGPARDAMQQLGINADDVSQKLSERGLAGTMQYLSDTVMQHFADQNHVAVGEMRNAAQAQANLGGMFEKMSPYARQHAEALANNTEGSRAYTMAMRGANEQDKVQMEQARQLIDRVDGFSKRFSNGRQTLETYTQAMNELTGTTAGAQIAFQTTGKNAGETNEKIQAIATTYTEADGTVKGLNESQDTLNAQQRDARAEFGAAATEIGSAFVPVMTDVANVAKTVGDEMAKHPGIVHGVIDALGALGGAWMTFKAINIAETVLTPIARGLGGIIAGEEGATAAAGRLSGALSLVGTAAAGLAAAQAADSMVDQNPTLRDLNHAGGGPTAFPQWVADHLGARTTRRWFHNLTGLGGDPDGHAAGGAIHGPGPNGVDSVPAWLAPGEHVLTHLDVAKMGGHHGVYAFRQALHRAEGGAVGPDVMAAESMVGTPYSQGSRNDCSGMVGRVVNAALGIGGGLPTTKNMGSWLAERGFVSGVGGPGTISVGWYDHGPNPNDGHAAMTLSDGENAESGGSHGNFLVGSGAAGANSAQFDHHMYLPNIYGEGMATGGGGMGGYGGGGGGGIPAGATPGTGPGGQPGYYTANPQRVAKAQERLRHLDQEIHNAEERRGEMKANAKQSERDRLDEEIRHLKEERGQAEREMGEAQRGTFHAGRGGRGGGMGGPNLPVPLPERFGLGKGLPGLAEWTVGFLEDLVLGPMETAAYAAMGTKPGQGGGLIGIAEALSNGGGGGGGFPQIGPGSGPLGPLTGPLGGGDAASAGLGSAGGDSGSAPKTAGPSGGSGGGTGGSGSSGGLLGFVTSPSALGGFGAAIPPVNAQPLPTDIGDQITRQQFLDAFKFQRTGPTHFDPNSLLGPGSPGQLFGPSTGDMRGQQLRDAFKKPPAPTPDQIRQLPGPWSFAQGHATGGPIPNAGGNWNDEGTDNGHRVYGYDPRGTANVPQPIPSNPDWANGPRLNQDPGGSVNWNQRAFGDLGGILGSGSPGNDSANFGMWHGGVSGYFATGGPSGTDTVPAWLTPGEYVENKSAVDRYGSAFMDALNQGRIDPSSVRYYDDGSPGGVAPAGPKTATPAPKPANQSNQAVKPGPNQPPGPPGPQQPGTPGQKPGDQPGAPKPDDAPKPLSIADKGAGALPGGDPQDAKTRQGLNQPGSSQETFGQELPASSGIGFGGGLLGAAEGAASQAAGAAASAGTFGAAGGAASSAMDMAFQLINRTAAYGAQAAGIGVEGLLETLLPADSPLSNFGNTLPGKVLAGVAGVRPGEPNTAGQTQAPLTGTSDDKAQTSMAGTQVGVQMNGPVNIHTNDAQDFHQQLQRDYYSAAASYQGKP